jgi:hypothetical protein
MLLRVLFLIQLVFGIAFWTGHDPSGLVLLHMFLGIAFVAVLWVIGALAAMRGASMSAIIGTFVLGLIIALFGLVQRSILPGSGHWVIQIIHLLLGMAGIGYAEMIVSRTGRTPSPSTRTA